MIDDIIFLRVTLILFSLNVNRWIERDLICSASDRPLDGVIWEDIGPNVASYYRGFSSNYSDVMLSVKPSLITGVSIVCSNVCSGADQNKHQSTTSLDFCEWIPSQRASNTEMIPFDDAIMS